MCSSAGRQPVCCLSLHVSLPPFFPPCTPPTTPTPPHQVLNLARFISVAKTRPLSWRLEHPYLIADRWGDMLRGGWWCTTTFSVRPDACQACQQQQQRPFTSCEALTNR